MERNISYPTDSKLLNKSRENLVKLAKENNIELRQNYNRLGKRAATKAARYAHAKQYKRMKKQIKILKNYLGRIVREIERKVCNKKKYSLFEKQLEIAKKLLVQNRLTKNKIYSIHQDDVYCIAKGKARNPYEYGNKVSIVATQDKGFILFADALEVNQHDSKSLANSIEGAEKNTNYKIKQILVDKGYRGNKIEDKEVCISGDKKHLSVYKNKKIKKRSAIEAIISEMKRCGKMSVNYLKGTIGAKINAIACSIGHNMRHLLVHYASPTTLLQKITSKI